ncbi:D-alanyl-D-alanine carboxypeptidase/D-alanyl-D-alanine endopeptidase [Luteibacter yeojuensis]|uniref:D-alanyl-D-alanine carboxypeptidase/D-alanyl-D-alanine-endopeptidase n=1 Tax=Luteibacter yeojuensis TaxID=345309 RepID=A0A7X5TPB2_9GAMM|nr:D-alanyl-D-alanine carboxypeptidase/D-alanyl-D-alanine-endopeptidase [Luteibacter yeojuensis]NID14870.1 D-alanyl-D-alanine carboxypeptidase/D-alanyl-D-alanine-endopeptidase [Luteibacter yeojuensis]
MARLICLVAGLLLASIANGRTLAQRIDDHLAEPRFAAASWGVSVVSLDDGRTVYAHDAGRLLLPASTAKLYTAAFALDRLGADYRTHTDVLMSGELRKGRLRGDLVLRGGGDPTLAGSAWADRLAATVRDRGIRRVDGAVVGDDTVFAGPPIGNGWEASDLQAYYGAQAGGLDIDENTMTATVSAGGVAVQPEDAAVAIALDPATPFEVYRAPGTATVHVLGADGERLPSRTSRLSLPDPALTAARRLRAALESQGVRVDGEARSVLWPVTAPEGETIASWPSPPLATILREGLKRSQNLYLQSVFLLSAPAPNDQRGGSAEDRASAALAAWLAARGIGPTSTTMVEGTGLSRHDLTTAASLTHLLATMDASPLAALWRGLLPVAGVDGTLANRMRDTAAQGNVVAKTGSMSFVNALAGYVTTKDGQRLAFAIVLNNYRAPQRSAEPVKPVSAEVDAIAVMLAETTERL